MTSSVRHLALFLAAILAVSPRSASAGRVTGVDDRNEEITISQGNVPWKIGDDVCVKREGEKLACGKVVAAAPDVATVRVAYWKAKLTRRKMRFRGGDRYIEGKVIKESIPVGTEVAGPAAPAVAAPAAPPPVVAPAEPSPAPPRALAAETAVPAPQPAAVPPPAASPAPVTPPAPLASSPPATSTEAPAPSERPARDVAAVLPAETVEEKIAAPRLNLSIGANYIFPSVQASVAVGTHYTLGVMPSYVIPYGAGSGKISGSGVLVTASYYDKGPFQGLWIEGGVGVSRLTFTIDGAAETLAAPAVLGAVGWRWYWASGTNFGFAVGVNGLFHSPQRKADLGFSGLLPALVLDLGFAM